MQVNFKLESIFIESQLGLMRSPKDRRATPHSQKSLPLSSHLHGLQTQNKNVGPSPECMLSLLIGCMNSLFLKLLIIIFNLGQYPFLREWVSIDMKICYENGIFSSKPPHLDMIIC